MTNSDAESDPDGQTNRVADADPLDDTSPDASHDEVPDDREFVPEGTFNDWIGLSVERYDEGDVVVSVEYEDFKRNPAGVMHGGVTATLIDVAGGVAIRSMLEDPSLQMSTTDLDVSYLRPVTDTAYAHAEVVRMGDSNAVVRVEVESTAPNGERKVVAIGMVTYLRH